jgi:Fucose permease
VAEAGSFISAYYIGPSLMSLPAGWMADRWGVLPSMVLGQALIAVGLVAVGGSHAFPLMAACMVVSGAGYGILNPTTTKAGMAWFPPRQRATVVGLKQVGCPWAARWARSSCRPSPSPSAGEPPWCFPRRWWPCSPS